MLKGGGGLTGTAKRNRLPVLSHTPNGAGLPEWPRFDLASRAYIQFTDAGPIGKSNWRRPHCDLFIENVAMDVEVA